MALVFQNLYEKLAQGENKLPVSDIVMDVVKSASDGKATILTSDTGSGKTLLASTTLADATDGQVVVLVPRRFLAMNAAETIAELSETELGKEVGFAVGKQPGDESSFSPDTKLLFTTYGYAISSGLINSAKTIVMDEVHEAGIDTSLARAIVHKRIQNGDDLRVLEMSATMDATRQAGYWGDVTESVVHQTDGKTFPCEKRHIKPKSYRPEEQAKELAQVALDLIEKDGRKGIAIFKPGVGEVNETATAIRNLLQQKGITNVEVETIYGEMDSKDRKKATRKPADGHTKILIGTNVIESGINLPWLDAGISDGNTKVPYFRETGAEALVVDDLPKWRLTQQEGRVKRFKPGIFVLHAEKGFEERVERTVPEIERAPLETVIMHAASLGLNPLELKFDSNVDHQKLLQAKERLQRLGLVDGEWHLTKAGKYVSNLPVGPEAGAMLWEAKKQGVLDDALELAAIIEVGGIRKDFRRGHGLDKNSDVIDSLKAFRAFDAQSRGQSYGGKDDLSEQLNVSFKRFYEAKELIRDLRGRHNRQELQSSRDATDTDLQRVILAGSVDRLFEGSGSYHPLIGNGGGYYDLERASAVSGGNRFITGELREIRPKKGRAFTIVQNVTAIPEELLLELAASRADAFSNRSFSRDYYGKDKFKVSYFGKRELEFEIPEHPSPAMQKLIEPEYSRFKLQENAKLLAQHFGVSSDGAIAATKNVKTIQEVADTLFNEQAVKDNLPVRISVGSSDVAQGMVRLGTMTIGKGSGEQVLHLEVAAGSLSAEQVPQLIKKYPAFMQLGKSNTSDSTHVFELVGNQVIIHTADERLWKNKQGASLGEIIKTALQSGVEVAISPVVVVDADNIASKYFPSVFDKNYGPYDDQDRADATKAIDGYKQHVQDTVLQKTAQGSLELGGNYTENKWIVPASHANVLAEAVKPLEELKVALDQRLSERKAAVEQVKVALKQGNLGEVSLGDGWNYKHSDYQLATGEQLMAMLDGLLRVKEIAEIKAPDGIAVSAKNVAFTANGQAKITLVLDASNGSISADSLAKEIKDEATKQGLSVDASSSYYSREITFNLSAPAINESKQIAVPDRVKAIEDRILEHLEALQKIPEAKEADRKQKEAEAQRIKAAEETRKAEETARRARESQEREAREIADAEKTQSQLISDLRIIADAGKGLPRDMEYYRPDYRTKNQDAVNNVIDELRDNGVSDKSKDQLLAEIRAEQERSARIISESGSVAEAIQQLGQGGSGLFGGAKIVVDKRMSGKPKPAHKGNGQAKTVATTEEKPSGRGNEQVKDISAGLAALQAKWGARK